MLGSEVGAPDDDANDGEADGNSGDCEDEESNLALERCKTSLGLVGHLSDTAEDSVVTSGNDDTDGGTRDTACTCEGNVSCFEVVLVGHVHSTGDGFSFTRDDGSIKFGLGARDEPEISGDLVTERNDNDITLDEIRCLNAIVRTVTNGSNFVGKHACDGIHDTRSAEILPCVEEGLNDDDDQKYDGEGQIRCLRIRVAKRLP